MFLAIRELKRSKLKYGLIGLIIFLIIFLVLFITGLAAGLANDNGSAIAENTQSYYLLERGSQSRFNRSAISAAQLQKLQQQLPDADSLIINQTTVQPIGHPDSKTDITYFVVDATGNLAPKQQLGQSMANTSTAGIVVSEQLKESGYRIGDYLRDSTTGHKFKIAGFTRRLSYAHTPVVYLNLAQYQLLHPHTKVSYQAIALNQKPNSTVRRQLKNLVVESKQQIVTNIPGYSAEQSSLSMMIDFLYLISVVILAVFFYVLTIQKLKEFGTLKALGTPTSYLARHLVYEMGIVTLAALIIDDLLILVLAQFMPSTMPFALPISTIIMTNILFLLITFVSSLLSMLKLVKVDPVSAIGGNAS